jgi:hypothetical protein
MGKTIDLWGKQKKKRREWINKEKRRERKEVTRDRKIANNGIVNKGIGSHTSLI